MIATFDGGGVRGYSQARVLARLERQQPFLSRVTKFAGTSIGAVTALWIATGRDVSELDGVYRVAAPTIFGAGMGRSTILRAVLKRYLGDKRLRDLERPVLTSALRTSGPRFFDPLEAGDRDELLVDVVLAATAAVPAFAPHKGLIDGGALAPDPAQQALAWATKHGENVDTLRLISFGTGRVPAPGIPGGLLSGILNTVSTAQHVVAETACLRALGPRYHRLQPLLDRPIGLAEVAALDELARVADKVDLTPTIAWLRRA